MRHLGSHFGQDPDADLPRCTAIIQHTRASGARLLVLPLAALDGYLADRRNLHPGIRAPGTGVERSDLSTLSLTLALAVGREHWPPRSVGVQVPAQGQPVSEIDVLHGLDLGKCAIRVPITGPLESRPAT